MIGLDEIIINNLLTKSDGDYLIHIDHATLLNVLTGQIQIFCLESTGITIDNVYRNFKDYVFFIQNNLIQFSGSCYSMSNFVINSRRVRLEKNGILTPMIIVNNRLLSLDYVNETNYNIPGVNNMIENTLISNEFNLFDISKDRQNVHNSSVLNKFKDLYDNILYINSTCINRSLSIEESVDRLTLACIDKSEVFKYNLLKVLKYCIEQNGYIYKFNTTETEILANTVSYMFNMLDSENVSESLRLLADNIVDCIEDNLIVCLTGRISRILNSALHLSKKISHKSLTVSESKEDILNVAMVMFRSNCSLLEIKNRIFLEYDHLDRNELDLEIDSWHLEDLY